MRTTFMTFHVRPTISIALALLSLGRVEVGAQTSDLSIEIGGSSVSPPEGVSGAAAKFLVAGITVDLEGADMGEDA